MAIDFPASPTLNQTFASGSTTWRWNGSSWVAVPQTITASGLGLGNVENTALSTWAGSSNLTTLGTVGTGTWNATNIGLSKGGTNASLTAVNGGVAYSSASALALTAAGTSGNVLVSNGAAAPSWASGLTLNAQQALLINPYGSGTGQTSELRFGELAANGSNYVGFKAADLIAANKVWILPASDGGKGQFLSTDGATNLSWSPGPYPCQGRLTLTSATPVPSADVTAATTLYFTPYGGNVLSLWNSTLSTWENFNFSEISLSIAGYTLAQNYDIFIYNNSGTPTLSTIAWTSNTARASALTTQNGVLVLGSDARYRYVGTFRTTGVTGQTEDSMAKRLVWNYYNRILRAIRRVDNASSWTYSGATSTTVRYQKDNPNNRIDVVCGEPQGVAIHHYCTSSRNTTGTSLMGINSQTTSVTEGSGLVGGSTVAVQSVGSVTATANLLAPCFSAYSTTLSVGYTSFGAVEYNNATTFTTTFYGLGQQGLHGVWAC